MRDRPIAARCRKVIDKVQPRHRRVDRAAGVLRAAALLLAAAPLAAQPGAAGPPAAPVAALGPDAAACAHGSTALLVRVAGLKDRKGLLRVSTYAATPEAWLARGKFLRRIDLPLPPAGDVQVCVALAAPGRLGVAVLHDRDGDHKADIFGDGGGFSNNPSLGLSKPAVDRVAFAAGPGVTTVDIKVKYL